MRQNFLDQKANQMRANLSLVFSVIFLASCSDISGRPQGAPPLKRVASVDVQKYLGIWYEIARYPNSFEKNCENVTAQYSMLEDGKIGVLNTCFDKNTGKKRDAKAKASVIEGTNNAALAVNFAPVPLPKGQGNYHILHIDADYSIALVGAPSGKYLWLLSRTPKIDENKLAVLLNVAKDNQFDVSKLEYVSQK